MSPLQITGLGALLCVVAGWLAVSFMRPGRLRVVIEWLSATALYATLLSLFLHLLLRALEEDSTVGQIGFGFLALLFSSGLCISLVNSVRAMLGAAPAGAAGTTN